MVIQTKETPIVKTPKTQTCTIECEICGEAREIKVQDRFQVTKCKEHQAQYRKMLRKEAKKTKIAKMRAKIEELECRLAQ